MPVPEIDRLAHEILDILRRDLPDGEVPDFSRMLRDGALVTLDREIREVDSGPEPLLRGYLKSLQVGRLFPQERASVWKHASRKFKGRPSAALFGLYAALERAEMQERSMPTPDLHADEEATLPLRGRPDNDVSGHEGAEDSAAISDECKRCGREMSHDGSALDLLGYCEDCGEQTQREYLARHEGAEGTR